MTVNEIISIVDTSYPNKVERAQKVRLLSALDGQIYNDVILTHEGAVEHDTDYSKDTNAELLIGEPYAMGVYVPYLSAQIDLIHSETGRFNNNMSAYEEMYTAYTDYYNRTHLPKQKKQIWY